MKDLYLAFGTKDEYLRVPCLWLGKLRVYNAISVALRGVNFVWLLLGCSRFICGFKSLVAARHTSGA